MFEIIVQAYLAATGTGMTYVSDTKYETKVLCDQAAQKSRDHVYAQVLSNPLLTSNVSIVCRLVKDKP